MIGEHTHSRSILLLGVRGRLVGRSVAWKMMLEMNNEKDFVLFMHTVLGAGLLLHMRKRRATRQQFGKGRVALMPRGAAVY